jgi:hypothetical protein
VYGRVAGARAHRRSGASGSLGISSLGALGLLAAGWLLLAVTPSAAPLLVAAVAVSLSPCRRLLVDAVASASAVNAVVVDVNAVAVDVN